MNDCYRRFLVRRAHPRHYVRAGQLVMLPMGIAAGTIQFFGDTEILMQRIAMRDRAYERNMEVAYIEELNQAYTDHFRHHYQGPPVLEICTNELDFVKHKEHLDLIEQRIRDELTTILKQETLPLGEPALAAE